MVQGPKGWLDRRASHGRISAEIRQPSTVFADLFNYIVHTVPYMGMGKHVGGACSYMGMWSFRIDQDGVAPPPSSAHW